MAQRECVAAMVCGLLVAAPALANGPMVGRAAGSIVPIDTEDVQLLTESVRIGLPYAVEDGRAYCRYRLKNLRGHEAVFEMAFVAPISPSASPDERLTLQRIPSFQVFVGGCEVPSRMEALAGDRWSTFVTAPPDSLPVWTVAIPPFDTVSVTMEYPVSWSGGGDGSSWSMGFGYCVRPASLWAGTIDSASICIAVGGMMRSLLPCLPLQSECHQIHATPAGYTVSEQGFCWEFRNWEPTVDPGVSFHFRE